MNGSSKSAKGDGKKIVILLIEDQPTILKVHKAFLERMGFEVDVAITGEQAFSSFKNYRYPLVILDGGLPDMTGLELALKIREHEKTSGISRTPLILLSGYTEELLDNWCNSAGIDAYAIKPIHPVVLEKMILRYVTP